MSNKYIFVFSNAPDSDSGLQAFSQLNKRRKPRSSPMRLAAIG